MSDNLPVRVAAEDGDERQCRRNLLIYRRALENRWNIPPDLMAEVVDTVKACLVSPDPRTRVNAVKCLMRMKQNDDAVAMEAQKQAQRQEQAASASSQVPAPSVVVQANQFSVDPDILRRYIEQEIEWRGRQVEAKKED